MPEKTEALQNAPVLSAEQEKMAQILFAEQVKEYQTGEEYIPISFDVDTEILADSPNIYAVVLPTMPEDGESHLRCAIINKTDTRMSEDGKSVTAYLKRDAESVVMVFNKKEEKIKEYTQKNEEMVTACLKQQVERSVQSVMPELGVSKDAVKSMPRNMVSWKGMSAKVIK